MVSYAVEPMLPSIAQSDVIEAQVMLSLALLLCSTCTSYFAYISSTWWLQVATWAWESCTVYASQSHWIRVYKLDAHP